jgi:Mg2+-importing ATPase
MNINNIYKNTNPMNQPPLAFWSLPAAELLAQLQIIQQGLSGDEAGQRLALYGSDLLLSRRRSDSLALFLTQFKSPITLILLFAAGLSLFLHEHVDVLIILAIVLISGLLGFL